MPFDLCKKILLFVIMARSDITLHGDEEEIGSEIAPTEFILLFSNISPIKAHVVFNYWRTNSGIEWLLQVQPERLYKCIAKNWFRYSILNNSSNIHILFKYILDVQLCASFFNSSIYCKKCLYIYDSKYCQ